MRTIPPALQTKLNSGVTTLCRCWIVTRRDGVVRASPITTRTWSSAARLPRGHRLRRHRRRPSSSGLRSAARRSPARWSTIAYRSRPCRRPLRRGDCRRYLVDWSEPSLNVLMCKGTLGEVRREGAAFAAELRSLAHRLAEESGRLYTATCSLQRPLSGQARRDRDRDDLMVHAHDGAASPKSRSRRGGAGDLLLRSVFRA